MAAAGSVISSSKAPLPLPHRIKTSKTNKARKMRHMQQGAEFPGNMPSRSGIDKHKLFDLVFFFLLSTLAPSGLKKEKVILTLSWKPTSQVLLCSGQVSAAQSLCCRSGSVRSPGRRPAWKELGKNKKEKERNISLVQSNNQSGIDQHPPVSSRSSQLST